MIIKGIRQLRARYDQLGAGDIFIGSVSFRHLQKTVLIDLLERGIRCLPSALSQVLNASKVAQTLVLKDWMLPHTLAIHRRLDLLDAVACYDRQGITSVVTKQDHMHCGHGVRRWENINAVYNTLGFSESTYPFVLQPRVEKLIDVRVIIVGDYVEAYSRKNPHSFRNNLSMGGRRRSFILDAKGQRFCRSAMERGKFPYAHIDLLIMDSGKIYLSEIALNGGIKGAEIDRKELNRKKLETLQASADNLDDPKDTPGKIEN
jgi:glutathione synthase/RimK-type ligase-like ATP-grasp enzyme